MTGIAAWRREIAATFVLGLPLAVVQLAQFLISTTVVAMAGKLGPAALAGVALGASVYYTVWMFCLGVVMAVAPLVARALGGGDHAAPRPLLQQGLWVGAVLGLPAMAVIWHGGEILLLLGQSPANAAAGGDYLRPLTFAVLPSLWFGALRAYVAAHSRPRAILVVALLGLAVNAVLAQVLMFGAFGLPALGLTGAGVAVGSTTTIMFAALLAYVAFAAPFRRQRLFAGLFKPDWSRFREIMRVGVPIGGGMVLEVAYFNACLQLMGLIGTDQVAAHQIALQFGAMSFMLPLGLGQAATVRVGYHAGGGDGPGAARAGWAALGLGLVCGTVAALLFWFVPGPLVSLFLDPAVAANRAAIGFAIPFLAMVAAFQYFDAAQAILMGALRGLKDTTVPMLVAGFCYWVVGLGFSVGLGFFTPFGGLGIWIGTVIGLAVAAFLLLWRFAKLAHGPATA